MSFKRVETAGDLMRFGCWLKVECIRCGAVQTLSGTEVAQVHGNRSLAELERRLKCSRCGAQAPRLVRGL